MHPIVRCAEVALRQHPHPALRLTELRELVAEQIDRNLEASRLQALLEDHPDRFKLLDPWPGPGRLAGSVRGKHIDSDPWVVVVSDPAAPGVADRITADRLRESVRWLGRGVDPRSVAHLSRWYAIALSERATRNAPLERAA